MNEEIKKEKRIPLMTSIIIGVILIATGWLYVVRSANQEEGAFQHAASVISLDDISIENEIELPARWGNIGIQMIEAGVIDKAQFESLYSTRGGLSESDKRLLYDSNNGNLVITSENSGIILNILWAFGLGNKNPILEKGQMTDEKYGGAGNFASTGGWTLSNGDAMNHYSMHSFVVLTEEQQALVESVSKGIFRPCCNNSTYFPDCNHGMAMLGLLELMASQGVSEIDMYKFALKVNTLWFLDQYKTIMAFFESKNISWESVDPKEILSSKYSSASGFQDVLSQVQPQEQTRGGSCGA